MKRIRVDVQKKTRQMVKLGFVDKNNLRFLTSYTSKVQDIVKEKRTSVRSQIEMRMKDLFQDSPYQIREELDRILEL